MAVALTTIRYFDANSAYHYTVDNQPLSDLESNDIALKSAIDNLSQEVILTGTWGTNAMKLVWDLTADLNKQFAYKISFWALQDSTVITGSMNSSYREIGVIGYNSGGTVTVSSSSTLASFDVNTGIATVTAAGNGNNLELTFSTYTGANGYLIAKIGKFRI